MSSLKCFFLQNDTMASSNQIFVIAFAICVCCSVVKCEEDGDINPRAVEEGRTLVHHAMKRLAILLPALMFKLGIMFTMILVSMVTSMKGLMVGSLLLALGTGHFIASRFAAVPAAPIVSLPHYAPAHVHAAPLAHYAPAHLHAHALHAPHFLDRSDTTQGGGGQVGTYPAGYQGVGGEYAHGQAYGAWKQ